MPHSAWFAQSVRKNYLLDSDEQKQPCSGAKWPIRLVWPSLWERGNSPHLVRKTTKRPKSRVQVSECPIRIDSPSLWERFFRRIWRARLRKDQKAMFKCTMPPSTWFVQFVRNNYYPVLRQQNSENLEKSYSDAKWPTRLNLPSLPHLASKTTKNPTMRNLKPPKTIFNQLKKNQQRPTATSETSTAIHKQCTIWGMA